MDEDREVYREWLRDYAQKHQVEVLAYCLMTNHVHWVRVPRSAEALQQVLRPVHRRYAQRVNRERGWKGHRWQGRFFSSPLDETYLWAAIRYVERNPVRAGMIERAEEYRWSSAACHCGLRQDKALTVNDTWTTRLRSIPGGSAWLVSLAISNVRNEKHLLY